MSIEIFLIRDGGAPAAGGRARRFAGPRETNKSAKKCVINHE